MISFSFDEPDLFKKIYKSVTTGQSHTKLFDSFGEQRAKGMKKLT